MAHTDHMKRTTLMVDEELLDRAMKASGADTYSATVNKALELLIRQTRANRIVELFGTDCWEGDLDEMRRDRFPDWGLD